jgi:hypothetical protein
MPSWPRARRASRRRSRRCPAAAAAATSPTRRRRAATAAARRGAGRSGAPRAPRPGPARGRSGPARGGGRRRPSPTRPATTPSVVRRSAARSTSGSPSGPVIAGEAGHDLGQGAEVDAEADAARREPCQAAPSGASASDGSAEPRARRTTPRTRFGSVATKNRSSTRPTTREVAAVEQDVQGDAVLLEPDVAEAGDQSVLPGAGSGGIAGPSEGHDLRERGRGGDRHGGEPFGDEVAGRQAGGRSKLPGPHSASRSASQPPIVVRSAQAVEVAAHRGDQAPERRRGVAPSRVRPALRRALRARRRPAPPPARRRGVAAPGRGGPGRAPRRPPTAGGGGGGACGWTWTTSGSSDDHAAHAAG